MGILSQKPKFKVAAPTIRKVVVPVEAPKPKPKFQFRDANSAPPTVGRSSASLSARPGGGDSSARSSKTLSASPRTSTSPTNRNRASQSPYPASDSRHTNSNRNGGDRKRKLVNRAAHRASPAVSDRIEFGNDSDTGDDDWEATLHEREHRKRKRLNANQRVDLDRQLVHPILLETLPKRKEDDEAKTGTKDGLDKDVGGDDGAKKVEKVEGGRDLRKLRIIHAKDVASTALKCVPVLGATEDEISVELQYPGSRHRER